MPRARMQPEVKARLLDTAREDPGPSPRGAGRELVVEQVRRWIFEGRLRDGDALSQEDLADILGVSRIPVRDGLIALESAGWVVIEPGVGARAVGLDAAAVRDSLELFGDIWALLIRRAVEQKGDPSELVAAAARVKNAQSSAEMAQSNDAFVRALRALAAAPRLDAAFRNAARIVPGDFFAVVPDAIEVQRRHVPRIGAAVARGDVEKGAGLALAQHRSHARSIIRLLGDRGVLL
jgi:DNA-binding GntR family transcriptional regulator